jgi:hypothetical protein
MLINDDLSVDNLRGANVGIFFETTKKRIDN